MFTETTSRFIRVPDTSYVIYVLHNISLPEERSVAIKSKTKQNHIGYDQNLRLCN